MADVFCQHSGSFKHGELFVFGQFEIEIRLRYSVFLLSMSGCRDLNLVGRGVDERPKSLRDYILKIVLAIER